MADVNNVKNKSQNLKAKEGLKQLKKQVAKLQKNKTPKIGFFQRLNLKRIGAKDGKIGLPKPDENSSFWISPKIAEELDSYRRSSSSAWLQCQMYTEFAHSEIRVVAKKIKQCQKFIESARNSIPNPPSEKDLSVRHTGEEKLSDTQVRRRRQRDFDKNFASYKASIDNYEQCLENYIEEYEELKQFIKQSENCARLLCDNAKAKISQRVAIYYGAAQKKHPQMSDMPSFPVLEFDDVAETTYMAQHKDINNDVEDIIKRKGV